MDFQERLKEKLKLLENTPDELLKGLEEVQQRAFKKILKDLKDFKLDENGNLKLSLNNIAQIEPIADRLRQAIEDSGFNEIIEKFGANMDEVKGITDEYFKEVFDVEQKAIMDAMYEQVKNTQLEILSKGAVDSSVIEFKQILQDSISTSDNFTNLVETVQENIVGSEKVPGKMVSYAKQNSKDAFSITERGYTTAVSDSLGIEFYNYTGGVQDSTRDFCKERVNKTFHYKEIEGWAKLNWDGKNPQTDKKTIFTLLGGYGCNHSLTPVGIYDVPKTVLQRNIANGNIKLEDLPKKVRDRI